MAITKTVCIGHFRMGTQDLYLGKQWTTL